MTDARKIIDAACFKTNQWRDQTYASAVVNTLAATGFRIIGPDEVDPVTVEKCAEVTEMYISMGWRGTEITEAIRAIGRKA